MIICGQRGTSAAAASVLSPTATDEEIVRLAEAEGRTILCFDLDFAAIVVASRSARPSVITFRTSKHSSAWIIARLDDVLPTISADLGEGVLVVVEDSRVRFRRLPILH